jgi:GNAT superfamily N-acetyltransferase
MTRWSLPDPRKYLTALPLMARAFGGSAFANRTSYIADGFTGTALWLPPDIGPDEETLLRVLNEHADASTKEDMPKIFEQMQKFRPAKPHWYLPMIGVDPAHQGAGLGAALMTEGLKAVDRDGLIAYLESSNPRNVSLYERHGFEVIGEIQSGSSPVVRPMMRRAR